ncbi:STAS domain-containing protein [Spirillospora sp. NPDC047279]|uniref:STAS domain-containing protein n=1 Tax=Spirillospora sp. NPDC047279 TaxID=3155478 RepID=UPI0033EEDEC8
MKMLRASVALHNGIAVVSLSGQIDRMASAELDSFLREVHTPHIVVDMAGITYLDGSGLAVLCDIADEVAALGGSLSLARLYGPSAQALRDLDEECPFAVFGTITRAVKTSARHRAGQGKATRPDVAVPA